MFPPPISNGVAPEHNRLVLVAALLCLCLLAPRGLAAEDDASQAGPQTGQLKIVPSVIDLHGQHAAQRIVVMRHQDAKSYDVTQQVQLELDEQGASLLRIEGHSLIAIGNGQTRVTATLDGARAEATVTTSGTEQPSAMSFELDIQPILTAFGCNSGACHGKARGQNGFALSLLGFDSEFDYASLTLDARGRRIFPASPERSLLLRKATAEVPHGGGKRFDAGSVAYQRLLRWIAAGAPRRVAEEPVLVNVTMYPDERLLEPGASQRLLVTAHYSDGTSRDVTGQTTFQSNEAAVVAVDADGLMTAGPIPGEAAVMARYMGMIATCRVAIPLPGGVPAEYYAELPRKNFIDDLVWKKLQALGITASPPADDATMIRRLYLDVIGRLPTPEEVRTYLADDRADKRALLIDQLLERPELADYWANKWADLLRPNPYRVGIKAVFNYDQWIRDAFRQNLPYDEFVRQIVTAQGSTFRNGAATLYRDRRSPDEIATLISQLFLGIRLDCAKCHHHPFEKWSQEDFYSFAAYFARVGRKGTGLSPPISGSEEIILTAADGSVSHPITGKVLSPRPLFGEAPASDDPERDPREALAAWMTSRDNPFFAQVAVNRVWADLMGRGLVDPVDDLRATNPATNEALLAALGRDFAEHGFDLKHLLRRITNSHVYGLSSLPTDRNTSDTRNYSRHYRTRLRAEVLADAICDITGVPGDYAAMPPQSRAMQLWTHRTSSLFLDTFGRPDANQDPPCERTSDTTVTQALHLMNAPDIHAKITDDNGRAAQLAASGVSNEAIVEELYLWVYSRLPSEEERAAAVDWMNDAGSERRRAAEDLLWALVNTPEFVFQN